MTRYLDLAEFFWLAEQVTGLDTTTLVKASRVELADSALHAPEAGFGDEDFYPDLYDKAAVLTCRLAWNHPLPDGASASAFDSLSSWSTRNTGSAARVRAAAQMTAVAEISTRRPAFQSAETPTRVSAVGIGGLPVSAARSPLPR